MKHDDLDTRMREREYFHGLRLLPGAWAIVRVDGRTFSRFTADRFAKPFDPRFAYPDFLRQRLLLSRSPPAQ